MELLRPIRKLLIGSREQAGGSLDSRCASKKREVDGRGTYFGGRTDRTC